MPVLIPKHRGLVRQAPFAFQERADAAFAYQASDVVFDLYGGVWSTWGYQPLGTNPFSVSSNVSWIYYSYTFDRILALEGTSLKTINPDTGAVTHTQTNAFVSGSVVTAEEWPQTGAVYLSDGVTYAKLTTTGTTFTVIGTTATRGSGKIIKAWKGYMWSSEPNGQGPNIIFPSNFNDPETFADANAIRIVENGPNFNALTLGDGVLFVHKNDSIHAITGSDPIDFAQRDLRTSSGAIGPTAVWTFEKEDYYIGKNGFYSYNVMNLKPTPLHLSIAGLFQSLWDNQTTTPGTSVSTFNPPTVGVNYVLPLIPLWAPDFGRRYMLFVVSLGSVQRPRVFRYDIDEKDWTEVFKCAVFNWKAFAHSTQRIKTYLVNDSTNSVNRFMYTQSYDTTPIIGVYATQQIDAGARHLEKKFNICNLFPVVTKAKYYLDINGIGSYPFNISPTTTETGMNLPQETLCYCCSVKGVVQGGLQSIFSGIAFETTEPEEMKQNRDFTSSLASTQVAVEALTTGSSSTQIGGDGTSNLYLAGVV